MTKPKLQALSLVLALAVAGCSSGSSLLNGIIAKDAPREREVAQGQNLSLPPDLNLPAPSGADSSIDAPAARQVSNPDTATGDVGADPLTAAPAPADQDIYAKYNISRTKPDGTQKTEVELAAELHKARLAEKRRLDPNYGTIKNIGGIFKDG